MNQRLIDYIEKFDLGWPNACDYTRLSIRLKRECKSEDVPALLKTLKPTQSWHDDNVRPSIKVIIGAFPEYRNASFLNIFEKEYWRSRMDSNHRPCVSETHALSN